MSLHAVARWERKLERVSYQSSLRKCCRLLAGGGADRACCCSFWRTEVQSTLGVSAIMQFIKKRPERRKHCALAVVRWSQKFSPRRRPPSRGVGRPKFNQLEMVITFIYKPSLVKIDACNFELSW